MKTKYTSDLDRDLFAFLDSDSQVNTHLEHLEIAFKEYSREEIESAANRLIDSGLIYIVKYINDKPLYSTISDRDKQHPYP